MSSATRGSWARTSGDGVGGWADNADVSGSFDYGDLGRSGPGWPLYVDCAEKPLNLGHSSKNGFVPAIAWCDVAHLYGERYGAHWRVEAGYGRVTSQNFSARLSGRDKCDRIENRSFSTSGNGRELFLAGHYDRPRHWKRRPDMDYRWPRYLDG
jgi:hypothetical protein